MLQRKSSYSARPAERPILAPAWLITLLASLVGGGLWMLYPRQDLERRLAQTSESALSVAYLHNLLRSDPENPQLRLLLAQRQLAHGELNEARKTLEPALQSPRPEVHRDALWALWELSYIEYQRTPDTEPQLRQQRMNALRAQLHALANEQWPLERQMAIMRLATQFGERQLSARISRDMAMDPDHPVEAEPRYERAAREALGVGDYAGSADLYLLARRATQDPQRSRAYFLAAVRALQSGNQPREALELAQREIGDLEGDRDILIFMTELARAAGRPDVADRYVRQLLRLALARQWDTETALQADDIAAAGVAQAGTLQPVAQRRFDDGASWLGGSTLTLRTAASAPQTAPARPRQPQAPALPFDDRIYTLGYEVFLENGKQEDAWAVAQAAVRQQPNSLLWRERLARVSDWTQRPDVALENWLYVAQKTQRDDAWQAVLRLAPGQFDDEALVQGLRYQLRKEPGNRQLLEELVDAYERIGDPQPALELLSAQAHDADTLELFANLAERAGKPAMGLEAWRKLLAMPGENTAERAMRAAVLALLQGHADEGLRWLESSAPPTQADEDAADYWRLTGQLAEGRQKQALAIKAYRALLAQPDADLGDHDALIRLLLLDQPLDAAQIAVHAWERFDQPRHVLQALTIYQNRNQWDRFAALLARIDGSPKAQRRSLSRLRQEPEFLRLVGSYHQQAGRMQEARSHFEAGLRISPESADMRQALIWLFIDGNDAVSLRTLLTLHEPRWSRDASMHDALAAAYQALSLPQTALDRYLTPRVPQHENDFLWLMNYADALDQNQQSDRAWRLRRTLMARQWESLRQGPDGQRLTPAQIRERWLTEESLDQTRRVARARLVLTQQRGDPAHEVLRELLRLDRDARQGFSNAAAETAIGWLQDASEYSAERAFLWHQYARNRSQRVNRPLWADITVALAEDDREASGRLLETFDERLPRYDRVNAARAVRDMRVAQSAAFEAQDAQYDDNPTHLQLTESLLAFSHQAKVTARNERLGGMEEQTLAENVHIAIHPRLTLQLGHESRRRVSTAQRVLIDPPQEKAFTAQWLWTHRHGESVLRVARRQSLASYTPWQIEHEQRLDHGLSVRVSLGGDLQSDESLPLRLAGMKDRASITVRLQATRRDVLALTLASERFHLQTGGLVGSSRRAWLDYLHAWRIETPSVEFGAFGSYHQFRRTDPASLGPIDQAYRRLLPPESGPTDPGYFLPESFGYYGLQASTNVRYETEYSRALQPFAAVSRTWHTQLGPGYGLRLGLAGSVLGPDHLSIRWAIGKSGLQSLGSTRDLQVTYRLHF
ncbi:tetratricopeptide repeat protein [Acidovorax lacteus]|uniref:PelB C-terminal domain-containing protein n=1 Tax=Acidovorax lacteus TaxID=1924988 RepID=A0ABP8L0P4_9BURK